MRSAYVQWRSLTVVWASFDAKCRQTAPPKGYWQVRGSCFQQAGYARPSSLSGDDMAAPDKDASSLRSDFSRAGPCVPARPAAT